MFKPSQEIYHKNKIRNLVWFVYERVHLRIIINCDAYFSLHSHIFSAFYTFTQILNLSLVN